MHPATRPAVLAAAWAWAAAAAAQATPPEVLAAAVPAAASELDTIEVSARGTAADLPTALATDLLDPQQAIAAPADFQDLVTRVPGVTATGQNGLFETFSIRGSGGNGILVLVGGMPVTAQRRAGVPVAFVEPALLGEVNVTRGPAVVHFGPGALGGAVSIEPRWFQGTELRAGYASNGDETVLVAGHGTQQFSLAAARHHAGIAEAADGSPLNTGYTRGSASLQWRGELGGFSLDALLLPSRAEDIGKSNSRYPVRDTVYPEDSHTLGRLRLRNDQGFEISLHGHEQELSTWNQRPDRADTFAHVSSLDLGATVQQSLGEGALRGNVGLEYLGRRDVTGFDADGSVLNRSYTLRDASEDGWSLFALGDWRLAEAWAVELGARHSRIDQDHAGAGSGTSDTAFTAGLVFAPEGGGRFSANLSSGYRFPTLEERFFTGVTPQGEIIGNPDLGAEHSLGLDLGYAWRGAGWGAEIHVWRMDVDDLIQQVELAPDTNGYTNIGEAGLHGAEAAIDWTATERLQLQASAQLVRGKDVLSGEPLYGMGPVSARLDAIYDLRADLSLGLGYSHRRAAGRPGFEELPREAVDVVDAELRYRLQPALGLRLYLRNALDERYFATEDELSALAPGRSLGVELVWRPG